MAQVLVLLVLLLSLITPTHAAYFGQNQIRNVSSTESRLAQATAIAVLNRGYVVSEKQKTLRLETDVLSQFCKDELFYNEPSVAFSCTGFLIAPDLLVTAGHCVYAVNTPNQEIQNESGLACEAFDWIFDYEKKSDGSVETQSIPLDRLYHCKQIIYAVQKETAPYADYALIQLDRPVLDRQPLKMSPNPVVIGEPVKMIGHPFGTPKKISDQGQVILNNNSYSSLVTNLDAFVGFSGSPVLNSKDEVIGVLVGGLPSANTYVDSQNKCERLNHCDLDGKNCVLPDKDMSFYPAFQKIGSEVQRIDPLRELLQKF